MNSTTLTLSEVGSSGVRKLAELNRVHEVKYLDCFNHPKHVGSIDYSIHVWNVNSMLVIETNGDIVTQEDNPYEFYSLLEEYGLPVEQLEGATPTQGKVISPELTGDLTGLRGDLTGLRGNVSELTGNVSELTGNVSELTGNVSELTGNVSGLRGNVSGLRGNVSGLTGNVSGLTGNVSGLTGIISPELTGDLTGLRGDLTGLRGDVSGLTVDIDDRGLTDEERRAGFEIME